MGQSCRVCVHPDRVSIGAALVANRDSLRSLAARYGVSKDSLLRHFQNHLEPRQSTELKQLTEPQSTTPHYDAFVERVRSHGKPVSRAEVATWGYPPDVLQAFIDVAVERGDLSRRNEP